MTDLFFYTDDRFILLKWDHLMSVVRIVARDSRRSDAWVKPTEEADKVPFDSHRTILRQTVADLLALEADLVRMGKDSPADALAGPWRELWLKAAAWVREELVWRFPHALTPDERVKSDNDRRAGAEKQFLDVVADIWPAPPEGWAAATAEQERPADAPDAVVGRW